MRDFAELNINEGGSPVARPPPSEAVLARFEDEFGVALPDSLLGLLNHANGGHPELSMIDGPGGEFSIDHFHHLDDDEASPESLWYAMRSWRPVLGGKMIPFASTAGGDEFVLNVEQSPMSIGICLHDEDFRTVAVSASFEAFIDGLRDNPDFI